MALCENGSNLYRLFPTLTKTVSKLPYSSIHVHRIISTSTSSCSPNHTFDKILPTPFYIIISHKKRFGPYTRDLPSNLNNINLSLELDLEWIAIRFHWVESHARIMTIRYLLNFPKRASSIHLQHAPAPPYQ